MAFSVTPTSGAGPYILSLDLANKVLIDGVFYGLVVSFAEESGVCPSSGFMTTTTVRNALLSSGTYTRTGDIEPGICGVYKVDVVDLSTSVIISTASVSIDNV